ncbi:MAG: hypothetical protein LBP75_00270 [Planctomycetota bacterium]|nr:hypothetical protein [Planctomycetota bacterium]
MTAATGVLVSWWLKPVLVSRYLFPAVGLLWLFFAIAGANLTRRSPRLFTGLCGVLLLFGANTFIASARYESANEERFIASVGYLAAELPQTGVFICSPTCVDRHGWWILYNYLPFTYVNPTIPQWRTEEALKLLTGKPAWIIAKRGEKLALPPAAEFRRAVRLEFSDFDLYHAPDAAAALPYLYPAEK